jgi:hypothetical protein
MIPAVPGQECDAAPGNLADRHRVAGRPIGGVDLDLFGGVEELIETRSPDDPDLGDGRHERQATFSPEDPEDPEDPEALDTELEDEESLPVVLLSLLALSLLALSLLALSLLALSLLEPESVLESADDELESPTFSLGADPLPERLSVR